MQFCKSLTILECSYWQEQRDSEHGPVLKNSLVNLQNAFITFSHIGMMYRTVVLCIDLKPFLVSLRASSHWLWGILPILSWRAVQKTTSKSTCTSLSTAGVIHKTIFQHQKNLKTTPILQPCNFPLLLNVWWHIQLRDQTRPMKDS